LNAGKERRVDLRDIYKKAEKLGDVVTEALY
jgi:hypothetical protein